MQYANHVWTVSEGLLIAFTTAGKLDDALWDKMIHDLRTRAVKGYFGASIGTVEVSSRQRRTGAEAVKERSIPASIITEDRLVRGVVTAASWLGADIRAFKWEELRDAVAFLKVHNKEQQDNVIATVNSLKRGKN